MDAVAPALIGLGLWLAYEAWTNPTPHPIAKVTAALGTGAPSQPGQAGFGAATVPVNQSTGVAQ